ncbi:class I SAM-dependent methyltransferase [Prochlorococcus sp. MIT 0801]|uniref:class I SAM-dependent methyltransferase n=1 Tax=Prochlorococcus sp. MIT 0801 TaxID=1501269 RepID=UPI0004F60DA6|nr:class I SAM-dependent methyltransferase [Prochlorococcus sp. MIT 0801]AIQ98271.1 methyltransferase [Prochlorococcus sp. MIT 0801]
MKYKCRHCSALLEEEVIDLGHQPPSNAYISKSNLHLPEITYPLKLFVCSKCWLVQLPEHAKAEELFTSDYAYFSSTSKSWCEHAKQFTYKAIEKLGLNRTSLVIEIASNDGYLLEYLQREKIPNIGIEPTMETAYASRKKGIETIQKFFGSNLANELLENNLKVKNKADLIIANNVLAHVPDINDFMLGVKLLLKNDGYVSIEFPHLLNLIKYNQFDTIYHEHYSYLSLNFVQVLSNHVGLSIVDVEELNTHGGSLRVWLRHNNISQPNQSVEKILNIEKDYGLLHLETYKNFQRNAEFSKYNLIEYLITQKKIGKKVMAYGAAAKGNTLINYAGIKSDLIPAVFDNAKSKQGKFLPGSHIPILSPEKLNDLNPDSILILPWNLIDELQKDLLGYKLFVAMPKMKEIS